MKALYISYDGMTDPLGQSQVIPYLIGLTKKGHSITLISCEKQDRFAQHQQFVKNLLRINNINWEPIPYSTLPSVVSKQVNLNKIQKKAAQICKANKPDIVHCRSYMAALIGLKLKNKYAVKFIFDMRGFWADERLDGKIWSTKNIIQKRLYRFFKKKEIEFLKNADYTISLTENAKNEILSWEEFQEKAPPIKVIPCCVDLAHFSSKKISPTLQQGLKEKLNIKKEDFIISYLGSIGTWYMLEEMLDFFNVLLTKKPNSKFLFITPDDKKSITALAKKKKISTNKLIIQSATRNEVPLYLSLSQLSIYFIKPLFSKKASSPTKTGEIMAMGIPIVTNTGIGDSDQILTDSNSGMLINQFDNKEYIKVIDEIDVLLKKEKSLIRNTAFHYFSLEKGVEDYQEVYKSLI